MEQWHVQLADGQVISVSETDVVAMIRRGQIFPNTMVCVTGHPWVQAQSVGKFALLFQVPPRRTEPLSPSRVRLILALVAAFVIGVPLTIFALAKIQEYKEAKQREKNLAIQQAQQDQERKKAEAAERAFNEMPPSEKLAKANEIIGGKKEIPKFVNALRYLEAIPSAAPEYAKAQSLKKAFQKEITDLQALKEEADRLRQKTEDERNKEASIIGAEPINSAWDGSVLCCTQYLKQTLNDPDSMKTSDWTKPIVVYVKKQPFWVVRCTVRAKNAFGAMIAKSVTFYIQQQRVVLCEGL
jgi:hypothetical protein